MGMFGDDDAGVGAGDVTASERCTAPLAIALGVTGFAAGKSTLCITLRAVSSASSSAESFGFETLSGSLVVFANWTDGGAVTLTAAGPSFVRTRSRAATERAIKACVAWFPKRCCNLWAGEGATATALRWIVLAGAGRRWIAAVDRRVVRSWAMLSAVGRRDGLPYPPHT